MRKLMVSFAVSAMLFAACGGDDLSSPSPQDAQDESGDANNVATENDEDDVQAESDVVDVEPSGPVALNTIRIGSTVWARTLPMTSGQCFLYEDDGTLPTSATAWGTLDGNDDIRFAAQYSQDGTFEAEVVDENAFFWIAGPRSPGPDDLEIELDFDTLTISGSGSFANAANADVVRGSFEFQCEPEDS
jgi:hypothetical protein